MPIKLRKDHSTGSRAQFQASKIKLDMKQNGVSRSQAYDPYNPITSKIGAAAKTQYQSSSGVVNRTISNTEEDIYT